jgi:hypothetical protein
MSKQDMRDEITLAKKALDVASYLIALCDGMPCEENLRLRQLLYQAGDGLDAAKKAI